MLPVMIAEGGMEQRMRQARPIDLLVGQKLQFVRLGHAIVLSFSGGSQVLIETLARLTGPAGKYDVEPGDNPSDILATLLGDVVRTARTRITGELLLTFDSGAALRVGVDPELESWAVAGPSGQLIVCLAQGEIAVWGDA